MSTGRHYTTIVLSLLLVLGLVAVQPVDALDNQIRLTPDEAAIGEVVGVSYCDAKPGDVTITMWDATDSFIIAEVEDEADADGCVDALLTVPSEAQPGATHRVSGTGGRSAVLTVLSGQPDPSLDVSPDRAPASTIVEVNGCDWVPQSVVDLGLRDVELGWTVVDDAGCLEMSMTVPDTPTGTTTVTAHDPVSGRDAQATFIVQSSPADGPTATLTWETQERLPPRGPGAVRPQDVAHGDTTLLVLDACDSTGPRELVGYTFGIVPRPSDGTFPLVEPRVIDVPRCVQGIGVPPGRYNVSVTVRDSAGGVDDASDLASVRDLLVVSIGDSYSSGEGNPDRPRTYRVDEDGNPVLDANGNPEIVPAEWISERCHRSQHGWPHQVARLLEASSSTTSVTYIGLACSGGQISHLNNDHPDDGGILSPYAGIADVCDRNVHPTCNDDDGPQPLPAQIDQLAEFIESAGRVPDVVLLSGGGNDAGFGGIVEDCLLAGCDASSFSGVPAALDRIEERLVILARELGRLEIPPDRVHLLEYPIPTRDQDGDVDTCTYFAADASFFRAEELLIEPMNQRLEDTAGELGFRWLDGMTEAFRTHGICADGAARYFREITESSSIQGNIKGAFHPNWQGHRLIRDVAYPNVVVPPRANSTPLVQLRVTRPGAASAPIRPGEDYPEGTTLSVVAPEGVATTIRVDGVPFTSGSVLPVEPGTRALRRIVVQATFGPVELPPLLTEVYVTGRPAAIHGALETVNMELIEAGRRVGFGRVFENGYWLDLGSFDGLARFRATSADPDVEVSMQVRSWADDDGLVGERDLTNGAPVEWVDGGEADEDDRDRVNYELTVEARRDDTGNVDVGYVYFSVLNTYDTLLRRIGLWADPVDDEFRTPAGGWDEAAEEWREAPFLTPFAQGVAFTTSESFTRGDVAGHYVELDLEPYELGTPVEEIGSHKLHVYVCTRRYLGPCESPGPKGTILAGIVDFEVVDDDPRETALVDPDRIIPPRPDCPTCVIDERDDDWADIEDRVCRDGVPPGPDDCLLWVEDLPAERLAGDDRIDTALRVSQEHFWIGEADAVVLARADLFPDALAGTPLAVQEHAPMLLTFPQALDERVLGEIERILLPGGTVYLLGGDTALSAGVASAIEAAGFEVVRLAGEDRYATATAIADRIDDVDQVLIATGENFPDGLAAGAAASLGDGAVVLTPSSGTAGPTQDFLARHPDASRFAIGGPAARVYPSAVAVAGENRHETATLVARQFVGASDVVALARSDAFPDALSGGTHVAMLGGPILLTPSDTLVDDVVDYLGDAGTQRAVIYGGTVAISEATEAQLQGHLR